MNPKYAGDMSLVADFKKSEGKLKRVKLEMSKSGTFELSKLKDSTDTFKKVICICTSLWNGNIYFKKKTPIGRFIFQILSNLLPIQQLNNVNISKNENIQFDHKKPSVCIFELKKESSSSLTYFSKTTGSMNPKKNEKASTKTSSVILYVIKTQERLVSLIKDFFLLENEDCISIQNKKNCQSILKRSLVYVLKSGKLLGPPDYQKKKFPILSTKFFVYLGKNKKKIILTKSYCSISVFAITNYPTLLKLIGNLDQFFFKFSSINFMDFLLSSRKDLRVIFFMIKNFSFLSKKFIIPKLKDEEKTLRAKLCIFLFTENANYDLKNIFLNSFLDLHFKSRIYLNSKIDFNNSLITRLFFTKSRKNSLKLFLYSKTCNQLLYGLESCKKTFITILVEDPLEISVLKKNMEKSSEWKDFVVKSFLDNKIFHNDLSCWGKNLEKENKIIILSVEDYLSRRRFQNLSNLLILFFSSKNYEVQIEAIFRFQNKSNGFRNLWLISHLHDYPGLRMQLSLFPKAPVKIV